MKSVRRKLQRGICSMLLAALLLALMGTAAQAMASEAQGLSVTIPGSVSTTGLRQPEELEFKVQLTAMTDHAPIPSVTQISVAKNGDFSFGPIEYLLPGDYLYTLTEIDEGAEYVTYDPSVIQVRVFVEYDETGKLIGTVLSSKDGWRSKADASFFNLYEAPAPLTSVSGEKIWDDGGDQDGLRPNSVTVNLLADGAKVAEQTVTAENGWKFTFDDVLKFVEGTEDQEIRYTVTEEPVDQYETIIDGTRITNRHVPGEGNISVTKVWLDGNDQDGLRPDSVSVQLYANGEPYGEPVELKSETLWKCFWVGLPEKENGKEIAYTVEELDSVEGYESTVSGSMSEGFTITNTHQPEQTGISGQKIWADGDDRDGLRPEQVVVRLYADGQLVAEAIVDEESGWRFSFSGLDRFAGGREIVYTLTEDAVDHYVTQISPEGNLAGQEVTVTNTCVPETTSLTARKVWEDANDRDGLRPGSVEVQLFADGEAYGNVITLSEENGWQYIWTGLYLNAQNGVPVNYTVQETRAERGYTSNVSGDAETGFVITNRHVPETVSVPVVKVWDDHGNQAGKRPKSITVHLLANGREIAAKTLTETDGWTYTWDGLPANMNGSKISYQVVESAVNDYTASVSGTTITNRYQPTKGPTPSIIEDTPQGTVVTPVKTGDTTSILRYAVIGGMALLALIVIVLSHHRKKRDI